MPHAPEILYLNDILNEVPPWWLISRSQLAIMSGYTVHAWAADYMHGDGPQPVRRDALIRAGNRRWYVIAAVRAWLSDRAPVEIDTDWRDRNIPSADTPPRLARKMWDQKLRDERSPLLREYPQPRVCSHLQHTLDLTEGPRTASLAGIDARQAVGHRSLARP